MKNQRVYSLEGGRIRILRVALGWSLRKFSETTHLARETVTWLDRGERSVIRPGTRKKIVEGVRLHWALIVPVAYDSEHHSIPKPFTAEERELIALSGKRPATRTEQLRVRELLAHPNVHNPTRLELRYVPKDADTSKTSKPSTRR